MNSTIEGTVKNVMSQVLGIPAQQITSESSVDTISQWDSLGHMNLCSALEQEFGVEFDDRQVTSMTNYDAIVQTLATLQRQ